MAEESLADRVRRLSRQTEDAARSRTRSARFSRSERVREDVRSSARFLYQFGQGLLLLWELSRLPRAAVARAAIWLADRYRQLWAFAVYRRVDDVLLFSKTRAAAMM